MGNSLKILRHYYHQLVVPLPGVEAERGENVPPPISQLPGGDPDNTTFGIFTYREMELATWNFTRDNLLGEGCFGMVYKGILRPYFNPKYNNVQVAIKELIRGYHDEWLAEVKMLHQLRHPNIVRLIGFCPQGPHWLLVYEYMENGSLYRHLFSRNHDILSWVRRMKIALDVAKGLAYLHGKENGIIIRDFKTAKVLLDENFNAKLWGFGLANVGDIDYQMHISTPLNETLGYSAPEYFYTGQLTVYNNVYAFGVLLLELLTGRKVLDSSKSSAYFNLVEMAYPLLRDDIKNVLVLLDHKLRGQYCDENAKTVGQLAYECISKTPEDRPEMSKVVEILESIQLNESVMDQGVGSSTSRTQEDPSSSSVEHSSSSGEK